MKNNLQKNSVHLGFQIAPMIDVVFVIMLYFMVMAGAVKVEQALYTRLPGEPIHGPSDPLSLPDEVAIRIADDGNVYMNDECMDSANAASLHELASTMGDLKRSSDATKSQVLVTIYAEENAKYKRIIDVLDALSLAKISNVTFQTCAIE